MSAARPTTAERLEAIEALLVRIEDQQRTLAAAMCTVLEAARDGRRDYQAGYDAGFCVALGVAESGEES